MATLAFPVIDVKGTELTEGGSTRALAYWLLAVGGAVYSLISVASLFVIDWDGISRALGLNLGLVSVALWLAWSVSVASLGALPIAAAFELRGGNRSALTMCFATVAISLALTPFTGWYGVAITGIYGTATALVASPVARRSLKASRVARWERAPKRSTVAYVLLIGGGLLGIHNYYLGRAWLGVLYFILLGWGTVLWPTNYFYLVLGALVVLNIWDAIKIPRRVTQFNRRL